eukprot:IDg7905t1
MSLSSSVIAQYCARYCMRQYTNVQYETLVAARRSADAVDMQLVAVENAIENDSCAEDEMDAVSASLRDELQAAEKTMLNSQHKEEWSKRRKRASTVRAFADSSRQEETAKRGMRSGKRTSGLSKDKNEKKKQRLIIEKYYLLWKTQSAPKMSESGVEELDTELVQVQTAVESLFEKIRDAKDVPTNAVVTAVTAEA